MSAQLGASWGDQGSGAGDLARILPPGLGPREGAALPLPISRRGMIVPIADVESPVSRLVKAVWREMLAAERDPVQLGFTLLDDAVRLALPRTDGSQLLLRVPLTVVAVLDLDLVARAFVQGWVRRPSREGAPGLTPGAGPTPPRAR